MFWGKSPAATPRDPPPKPPTALPAPASPLTIANPRTHSYPPTVRDPRSSEALFGSIFTLMLWRDVPQHRGDLAAGFGLHLPRTKAQRDKISAFGRVVIEMVKAGWIEEWDRGHAGPRYVPVYAKLFEFYERYPSETTLDELINGSMRRFSGQVDEMPHDTRVLASIVIGLLVFGESSLAHTLISKWSQPKRKVFPRGVASNLAERLGPHIPPKIWNERMPKELKPSYLAELAQPFNLELRSLPEFWRTQFAQATGVRAKAQRAYTEACESDLDPSQSPIEPASSKPKALAQFSRLFWSGRYEDAYEAGMRVVVVNSGLKESQIRGIEGLDMMLCCIAVSGTHPEALAQAQRWADKRHLATPAPADLHLLVYVIVDSIFNERPLSMSSWLERFEHGEDGISPVSPRLALMIGLGLVWTNAFATQSKKEKKLALDHLKSVLEKQDPPPAVKRELKGVITALEGKPSKTPCLATSFQMQSAWERLLDRLQSAVDPTPPAKSSKSDNFEKHVSWVVEAARGESYAWLDIQPRIITSARAKRGTVVRLGTLKDNHQELLSDTDRAVLSHLKLDTEDYFYPRGSSWSLGRLALVELVGHPHVQNKHGDPLKIEQGIVELRVEDSKAGIRISVEPDDFTSESGVAWRAPNDHRVIVYQRPPALKAALEIFGKKQILIPQAGAERLLPILETMSKHCRVVTNGEVMAGQNNQESDPSLYVSLRWSGSILWVDPQVFPLGDKNESFFPGHGDVHLTVSSEGGLCTTSRNLGLETKNLEGLLEACPLLAQLSQVDFEQGEACRIDEIEDALSVVMELAEANAQLAWESEQVLAAPAAADDSRFKIRLGKARDWFQTDVSYEADQDQVLGFQELIEARIGDSRFLKIGKDEILALSESMKQRLDKLAAMGELTKSGVKSAPTSLPVIDSLVSDFKHLELDKGASEQLKALRRALSAKPALPRTLNATLRPYQEEGYRWMFRLAKAQLGACLADDMGLGKTVQTLALLCKRQTQGPALVVAPASVVRNWIDETQRFAPKLKSVDLSELRHDFDSEALGAKDLVVTSYGIMTKEIEQLEQCTFATIVFDEAHALKNWGTRRTQAAARLSGDFRLGLTGTPVENHVGEIWSLFQILVPGLLGTKKQFEAKYSLPAGGAIPDTKALRAQLEPFLLRRTKSQVLTELPELNESVLKVVPSAKEAAFYQALQKSALKACQEQEAGNKPDKRLKVLAEISRLRQAAVDPRLIDELLGPEGEKIQLLIRKLVALQKEGHRALVFTQFLGSLALVRDALEQAGIEYFELTGSTPPKKRAKLIDAFQAGNADVFLISLRAGGVGVNLTGADYVFHLDPWWNPAVEDQATARAHRMGQTSAVQVYRLITAGTIEEKITQMHELKRGLAEDLLGNLDKAKKLSLAQLRELLSDT